MRAQSSHKSHNGFGADLSASLDLSHRQLYHITKYGACTKEPSLLGILCEHTVFRGRNQRLCKIFAIQAVADDAEPKTSNGRFECEIAQRTPMIDSDGAVSFGVLLRLLVCCGS